MLNEQSKTKEVSILYHCWAMNRIESLKNKLNKSFVLILKHNEHYDHHVHQIVATNKSVTLIQLLLE
jgi:hypothetical protein